MWSLQLVLQDQWDFEDESVTVSWTSSIKSDLNWWFDVYDLAGVSLVSLQPDLFWSDASDQGWGGEPPRPVHLGLLVTSGAGVLQPSGTPCYSSQAAPLPSFSDGSFGRGVLGQHNSPVIYSQARGHLFTSFEPQGSASPSLGRIVGDYSNAPVHHGGMECGGFPEPSGPGHRFRVDPGSGGGRRVEGEMASDGRPLCHLPQLSSSRLLLPLERSHGGRDGCLPPVLGRAPSVCLFPVRPHPQCHQQTALL